VSMTSKRVNRNNPLAHILCLSRAKTGRDLLVSFLYEGQYIQVIVSMAGKAIGKKPAGTRPRAPWAETHAMTQDRLNVHCADSAILRLSGIPLCTLPRLLLTGRAARGAAYLFW
jgi:hypothetical protein